MEFIKAVVKLSKRIIFSILHFHFKASVNMNCCAKWFDFHLIMHEFVIVALVKLLHLMTRGFAYEYF